MSERPHLRRPWWKHYGRIATHPIAMELRLAASYLRVCAAFIHEHAAVAETHGWQPAHLMGAHGLARSWAMIEFMPPLARFETGAMIYPSPLNEFAIARSANPDGTVGLISGEAYVAICGRHLGFLETAGCAAFSL